MLTQQYYLMRYALTPEERQAIVQRAHRERAKVIGEFLSRLFNRRKVAERESKPARGLRLTPAE